MSNSRQPEKEKKERKKKKKLMKDNKSYERCMFNQMKPILAMQFLYILQGQASGFHTLMNLLNSSRLSPEN